MHAVLACRAYGYTPSTFTAAVQRAQDLVQAVCDAVWCVLCMQRHVDC